MGKLICSILFLGIVIHFTLWDRSLVEATTSPEHNFPEIIYPKVTVVLLDLGEELYLEGDRDKGGNLIPNPDIAALDFYGDYETCFLFHCYRFIEPVRPGSTVEETNILLLLIIGVLAWVII